MNDDKCREAFEAWCDRNASGWGRLGSGYTPDVCQWAWVAWQAAWKPSPPPVSRDGWLTEEEIDSLVERMISTDGSCDDLALNTLEAMARAAIRLHAERSALFTQLKAAIETCERGNV